jgi:AAA domain-containing protein
VNAGNVSPLGDANYDHYLRLHDANVVATDALLTTQRNLQTVISKQAMMCVHGGAGLGKTLSVNQCLREIAPSETVRVEFNSHPRPRDVRMVLFEALEIPGRPPRRPFEFNQLLKEALSQEFRILVCDESQWLSRECFELYRYLWDQRQTQIAIIFVGGDDCYRVLKAEPMLASRIYIWQGFQRLSRAQVQAAIPAYHPIWENADPADIIYTDQHAAHGNFRAWAKITSHAVDAMAELGRTAIDRDLLRWVFSNLGGR